MINKHVENIVIGKPIVDEFLMFSFDEKEWNEICKFKTIWIEERFLGDILTKEIPIKHFDEMGNFVEDTINLKVFPSKSQLRKNRPDLFITLDSLDFKEIKIGKKRFWILIGN